MFRHEYCHHIFLTCLLSLLSPPHSASPATFFLQSSKSLFSSLLPLITTLVPPLSLHLPLPLYSRSSLLLFSSSVFPSCTPQSSQPTSSATSSSWLSNNSTPKFSSLLLSPPPLLPFSPSPLFSLPLLSLSSHFPPPTPLPLSLYLFPLPPSPG